MSKVFLAGSTGAIGKRLMPQLIDGGMKFSARRAQRRRPRSFRPPASHPSNSQISLWHSAKGERPPP